MITKLINKIKKFYYDEDYILDYLAVITGQKCTLRCKNCCNFSPFHSQKLDFYNADKIINDIENITKRIKHINRMQIQGGDFFLHKDAAKILKYVESNNKIHNCLIATNCILLPKQEILDILKNPKFIIRISSYGSINEINKQKFEELLVTNNIRYKFHHYAKKKDVWSNLGEIDIKKKSKTEVENIYKNCTFKVCLTLENGIIARCARATVAHFLQKFKPRKNDFINIRNPFFAINELKKYINATPKHDAKGTPFGGVMMACYYCNGTSGDSIVPGEQLSAEELFRIKRKYK